MMKETKSKTNNNKKKTVSRHRPLTSTITTTSTTRIQPPEKFICPLTLEVMEHPVMSKYGHNFERSAIMEWLCTTSNSNSTTTGNHQNNGILSTGVGSGIGSGGAGCVGIGGCCPLTRQPLKPSWLISNVKLQTEIQEWKLQHGYSIIPKEFICPISQQIMKYPLLSKYGHHFDRDTIFTWFRGGSSNNESNSGRSRGGSDDNNSNDTNANTNATTDETTNYICPITGFPLKPSGLISDLALQQRIEQWKSTNDYWEKEEDEKEIVIDELDDEDELDEEEEEEEEETPQASIRRRNTEQNNGSRSSLSLLSSAPSPSSPSSSSPSSRRSRSLRSRFAAKLNDEEDRRISILRYCFPSSRNYTTTARPPATATRTTVQGNNSQPSLLRTNQVVAMGA